MSAKIVVHRVGEGDDLKMLHITFAENDKASVPEFGDWQDAKDISIKKEKEKSRLIIRAVSDENSSILDLDSCAKKIETTDRLLNNFNLPTRNFGTQNELKHSLEGYQYHNNIIKPEKIENDDAQHLYNDDSGYLKHPLEYSLEKVKENNAKIMENIHILNRTLNYTRKNEILGVISPKTFHTYPCEECGKCFVYETGLRRHYAIRHANLDAQQRWQIVWTCNECFQVWPRKELALNHANQCCKRDSDWIQEIKTSSVLQCEFCEKVFTNIPRLLRHLKTHTVNKNYECHSCNIAFSCYKTAEQHWLSCLWLKMFYQFALPKLLLCNACDRKFRNYDQLYNHRYKVGHFIPKLFANDDGSFMPTLAYQCEICGQWFNAITQMQSHRNQYHQNSNNGLSYNLDMQEISEK